MEIGNINLGHELSLIFFLDRSNDYLKQNRGGKKHDMHQNVFFFLSFFPLCFPFPIYLLNFLFSYNNYISLCILTKYLAKNGGS